MSRSDLNSIECHRVDAEHFLSDTMQILSIQHRKIIVSLLSFISLIRYSLSFYNINLSTLQLFAPIIFKISNFKFKQRIIIYSFSYMKMFDRTKTHYEVRYNVTIKRNTF
jgi:hypothetical protein